MEVQTVSAERIYCTNTQLRLSVLQSHPSLGKAEQRFICAEHWPVTLETGWLSTGLPEVPWSLEHAQELWGGPTQKER